ncbi:MAG TPA: beta-ketoacyl synthase chain length factor [Steroidobacteraceae bacterium]|nr:beta-ketoacyl synthase chain length factor [Steroidobacteraceae bacterium]
MSTRTLSARIRGIGLLGPGIDDWPTGAAILAGSTPYVSRTTALPAPTSLPAAERRRTGAVVRLALAIGFEAASRAGVSPSELVTVFSSSGGDGYNCHEICQTLASNDRQLSPTRFHNSVHNAASGYWSIAAHATPASNVLCAFDASFGAGLLEALALVAVERIPVLLVAYDAGYPEPLHRVRPIPDAFGVALVLSPATEAAGGTPFPRITAQLTDDAASTSSDPGLEALRSAIPAARSLPLLTRIARADTGRVVLDYLENQRIAVEVFP